MNFRNFSRIAGGLLIAAACSVAHAGPIGCLSCGQVQQDRYIGADDNGYFDGSDDAIGDHRFDVSGSSVSVTSSGISWTIHTNFANHVGAEDAYAGDLFFGFDSGWSKDTSGLSQAAIDDGWFGINDDASNGTKWTHAVHLLDKESGDLSGDVELYEVDTSDYANAVTVADDYYRSPRYVFRNGQEVEVLADNEFSEPSENPNSKLSITSGSWERDPSDKTFTVSFEMGNLSDLWSNSLPSQLAYHWTMYCGNDVVENAVTLAPPPPPGGQVPEPASILVFAGGAMGLGLVRRRRGDRS